MNRTLHLGSGERSVRGTTRPAGLASIVVIAVVGVFGVAAIDGVGRPSQNSNTQVTIEAASTTTIAVQGGPRSFAYLEWSHSTPASFTLDNVNFALWTNTTVTYSGGSCYGPSSGYAGYTITFSDGLREQLTTCTLGPNPPQTAWLTNHVNPQAGILIVPSTGQVFFLVGIQTASSSSGTTTCSGHPTGGDCIAPYSYTFTLSVNYTGPWKLAYQGYNSLGRSNVSGTYTGAGFNSTMVTLTGLSNGSLTLCAQAQKLDTSDGVLTLTVTGYNETSLPYGVVSYCGGVVP